MPRANRAAQFMPFSALSGYEEAVQETARQTDNGAVKVELLDAGGEVGEVHASGSVLLVAGGGGEGRLFERSAGDLNQIKTEIGKMLDDLQGLVFGKFAGLAVRRVELDCHGGN